MVAEREQTLEERHAAARVRWLAHYEGDPEMQEIVRKAKFDTESTPSRRRRRTRRTFASRTSAGIRASLTPSRKCSDGSLKSTPTKRNISSLTTDVPR